MFSVEGYDIKNHANGMGVVNQIRSSVFEAFSAGKIIYPVLQRDWKYDRNSVAGDVLSMKVGNVLFSDVLSGMYGDTMTGVELLNLFNLDNSLCYVEMSGSNGKVDKFLATRCMNTVSYIVQTFGSKQDEAYYANYLGGIRGTSIPILKVNILKESLSITVPRSVFDLGKMRVLPMFMVGAMVDGIARLCSGGKLVRFHYLKDNGTVRTIDTSANPKLIDSIYGEGYSSKLKDAFEAVWNRGYLKIPEIGLSRYDESGTRSLNFLRILGIEVGAGFDKSYIEVDFSAILPTFIRYVDGINSKSLLDSLYFGISGSKVQSSDMGVTELKQAIISTVNNLAMVGSTEFLRSLHSLMVDNPKVFVGYTGKKVEVVQNVEGDMRG